MALFVTGDTHGADRLGLHSVDGYVPRLNMSGFPEQRELNKDDVVVICGDFGGIWDTDREAFAESPKERHDLDWLDTRSFTTVFVPGNHENYDRLTGCRDERLLNSWLYEKMPDAEKDKLRQGYPWKEWNGGTVRVIRPSVLMLESGVFDIGGYKCLAYGGAKSHDIADGILDPADFGSRSTYRAAYKSWQDRDRMFRVKGISWWEQEQPGPEAEESIMAAATEHGNCVDYIFTHEAAISDYTFLGYREPSRINYFLQELKETVQYKHWFFGHYHNNCNIPGNKEHLLYEQVVQIG